MKFPFLLLLSLLAFASCDQIGNILNDNSGGNPDPSGVNSDLIIGRWSVDLFLDEGDNETSSFADISLVFSENGQFAMWRNNNVLAAGTWSLTNNGNRLRVRVPALANENESLGEDLYEIHDDFRIDLLNDDRMHLQEDDERFELRRL